MDPVLKWLLEGDVSIQYQTQRDLLEKENTKLQQRIPLEGWGKRFLDLQKDDDNWGKGFYLPKWISTHYTLLDLKYLNMPQTNPKARNGVNTVFHARGNDICVNGMVLNYASYFQADPKNLKPIIDFLLAQKMADGGFNCDSNRKAAIHSSLHTTLSVLEGLYEYRKNGHRYRLDEILEIEKTAIEFILLHRLFISDHTQEIIDEKFLRYTFPFRWKYTILRALDYFQYSNRPYDIRMKNALDHLMAKRNKDDCWKIQSKFSGAIHFEMEKAGKNSRWITLIALRILKHYKNDYPQN